MQQNQQQQQQQQQRLRRAASTSSGSPGLAIQLDGDTEGFHGHADDVNFGMGSMPPRAEKPVEMAWLRFDAESPYISFDMQCSNTPSSSEAPRPTLLSDHGGEVAQIDEVHEPWPSTNGHASTMSRQATSVSTSASMSAPTTAPASTATSESSNTSPDLASINNGGHTDGNTGSNKRKSLLASSVAELVGSKTEKASTHRRQSSVGKKAGGAMSRSRSRNAKRQSPDSLRSRFADGLVEVEETGMERANASGKTTGNGGIGKLATGRARPSRRATVGPAAQAAAQAAIQQPLRIDAKGAAEVAGPTGALWSSGRARSSSRGICLSPTSAKSLPSMDDGQHASAWPPPPSPAIGGHMSLQDFLKQPQGESHHSAIHALYEKASDNLTSLIFPFLFQKVKHGLNTFVVSSIISHNLCSSNRCIKHQMS